MISNAHIDIDATLAAIALLRATDRWLSATSVGQKLLCHAWQHLEDDAKTYLTGH